MKGCDSCLWFTRIKKWIGRVGVCDYEDASLYSIIKQCKNHKSKKYYRKKQKLLDNNKG